MSLMDELLLGISIFMVAAPAFFGGFVTRGLLDEWIERKRRRTHIRSTNRNT